MDDDLPGHIAIKEPGQGLQDRQLNGGRLPCIEQLGKQFARDRRVGQAKQANGDEAAVQRPARAGELSRPRRPATARSEPATRPAVKSETILPTRSLASRQSEHRTHQRVRTEPPRRSVARAVLAPGRPCAPSHEERQLVEPGVSGRAREEARVLGQGVHERQRPPCDRAQDGGPVHTLSSVPDGDRRQGRDRSRIVIRLSQRKGKLETNHRIRIAGQGDQLRQESGLAVEPALGQPDRLLAHPRLGIVQAERERVPVERVEQGKSPQSVQAPRAWDAALTMVRSSPTTERSWRSNKSRWAVSRHHASGSASSLTSSAAGASLSFGLGRRRAPCVDQVIEPSAILAAGQVKVPLDRLGDRERVFDRLAVHVEDEQRPIGRVGEVDRAKPVVGRGEELHARISPGGEKRRAVDR